MQGGNNVGWNTDDLSTGLVDDYDFTVQSSTFGFDSRYANGEQVLLKWSGTTDNPDLPTTDIWFSMGKGFVTQDNGKSVVHEAKPGKKPVRNSQFGCLMVRVADDLGAGEALGGRGHDWNEAEAWEGFTFHIKSEKLDYGSGALTDKPHQMPTAVVAVPGGSAPASNGTAAAASSNGNGNATGLKAQVIAVFAANTDFTTAQKEALAIEGVQGDTDLLISIMDPANLWAQVKG